MWLPAVSPDGRYWFDGKIWVSVPATPRRALSKSGLAALAVGAALLWTFGLLMMGDPAGPDEPIHTPQWGYWLGLTGTVLLALGAVLMTRSALGTERYKGRSRQTVGQ